MADKSIAQDVNVVYPKELEYPPVSSVAEGITQTKLRIPAITSLPASTPPSYEIRLEIPELPHCLLDPATTGVNFTVTFSGDFRNNAAADPKGLSRPQLKAQTTEEKVNDNTTALNLSGIPKPHEPFCWERQNAGLAPSYIIGGAQNFFNRQTTWLNGNVITDDIQAPGLLSHYLKGMTSGIDSVYGGWHEGELTLNLEDKGSSIGIPLIPGTIKGVYGEGIQNIYSSNLVTIHDSTGAVVPSIGLDDDPAVTGNYTWTYSMNFQIPLLGLMGKGNTKMIPMFCGPIRLCFYTNSIENIFLPGASSMRMTNYKFDSFEFTGTYFSLQWNPMRAIIGALPSGLFMIRTTSFSYSNIVTEKGASGQNDYPIAARRASNKFYLITWQPGAGSTSDWVTGKGTPLEGQLCSVNPNLTMFTGMCINGTYFPKQGLDPSFKPMDTYFDNLQTLRMASNNLNANSDYNFFSWLVSEADLGNKANGGPNGRGLGAWRQYKSYYLGSAKHGINFRGGVRPQDASFEADLRASVRQEKNTGKYVPDPVFVKNAATCLLSEAKSAGLTESLVAKSAGPIRRELLCNFSLAIDMEVSRGQYLSGQTTYTGSTFFRANYLTPTEIPGTYHVFGCHDAVVAWNPSDKTVAWKV